VAYNSIGGGELINQHFGFQRAFFDHYYPVPAVAPMQPPVNFAERAGRFVGYYRFASWPATTFEKAGGIIGGNAVEIRNPRNGTLLLSIGGYEWRFAEVAPLYFHQADGPFAIVFREDGAGRITQMYTDLMPQYTVVKLNWYETPGFNMALLLGCALVFLSMIIASAIRTIRNRRLNGDRKPSSPGARLAGWIILGICVLNLLFVAGMVPGFNPPTELLGPQLIVKIVLGLGVLSAVVTVAGLVYAVLAWKYRYWGITFRLYYTLVTIAAVAFVWFLNYWNLLGWRF
jgi:hypothetical protein